MKIKYTTPDSTGDTLYSIIERVTDGYWYNTVDDGFDPPDTTIDGSFDPYVDLIESSTNIFDQEVTLDNQRYRGRLFLYRGSGDKDHTLDTELFVESPVVYVSDQTYAEEKPIYVQCSDFTQELVDENSSDITALDTDKLESSDVNSALIGKQVTNVIASEVPDGIITDFTFAGMSTLIANSEIVTVDGVQQIRTVDYTIAGAVVTFIAGHLPQAGEVVVMNGTITATWA